MKFIFVALFAFLSLQHPAFSQEAGGTAPSDSAYTLPEIKVHSTRYSPSNRYVAGRVAVLDQARIESTGGHSLGQILQRASGVFIRQYGSGLATLSMRGGNSSHSIVTIDGMPLYDPQLGQVDLSLVPSLVLESISILHGQSSSMYGANGFSGVVDIETLSTQRRPVFASFKAGAGAFGERHMDLNMGFRQNHLSGLFAVRYGGEKGDFPYEDPSLFPVETVKREGADQKFSSYFGKVEWLEKRSLSTVSAWFNTVERGLPGPITLQFRDERQWDSLFRVGVQHARMVPGGTFTLRSGLQSMSLRYANPLIQLDDTGESTSVYLDMHYKLEGDSGNSIKIGVDNASRMANHPSLSNEAHEYQASAYIHAEQKQGAFVILPALRLDHFGLKENKNVTAWSPNLGLNIHFPSLPKLFLKMQAGRSFKMPTFNDRYWQPGGNIDLRPEVGWGYEAGAQWIPFPSIDLFSWSSEVTGYRRHVRDQITWLPTDLGFWSPSNVASVLVSGLESSFRIHTVATPKKYKGHVEILYQLTDARNQSDPSLSSYNRPLRYTPKHVLKVNIGSAKSLNKWTFGIDAFSRYASRRYVTEDGSASIPGYWTADLRGHVRVSTPMSEITLLVLLENMFDQDYEIIKGYVMPPRLIRVELGFQWPAD